MGGDSFFRVFFIAVFVILFLAGAIMLVRMEQENENRREVTNYLNSKGKTPIPRSWRGKMGKGI